MRNSHDERTLGTLSTPFLDPLSVLVKFPDHVPGVPRCGSTFLREHTGQICNIKFIINPYCTHTLAASCAASNFTVAGQRLHTLSLRR